MLALLEGPADGAALLPPRLAKLALRLGNLDAPGEMALRKLRLFLISANAERSE